MTRIQLGAGGNNLPGWLSYDKEIDVTKRLPWEDNSVDLLFHEHLLEHLTIHEGWLFLEECYRILKPSGMLRVLVPSPVRLFYHYEDSYGEWITRQGWAPNASRKEAVKALIFQHEHKTAYTEELLQVMLNSIGFMTSFYHSPEFFGCQQHQNIIGKEFNDMETIAIEGIK